MADETETTTLEEEVKDGGTEGKEEAAGGDGGEAASGGGDDGGAGEEAAGFDPTAAVGEDGWLTKEAVDDYLRKHELEEAVNDILNSCVEALPSNPFAYCAEAFEARAASSKGILAVAAREVLNSSGVPALEVEVHTGKGVFRSTVASSDGSGSGFPEAVELRDGDESRYGGRGVIVAVKAVMETVAPLLVGKDPTQQVEIDELLVELDGTEDKSRLGCNTMLAVSMAVCRAGARQRDMSLWKYIGELAATTEFTLPVPIVPVLAGGRGVPNSFPFRDVALLPTGAETFRDAVRMAIDVSAAVRDLVSDKYGAPAAYATGSWGALAPPISSYDDALSLLRSAIDRAGLEGAVKMAVRVGGDDILRETDGLYNLEFKTKPEAKALSKDRLSDAYVAMLGSYPVVSLEDPFGAEDWEAWAKLMENTTVQIVGDGLLSGSRARISEAVSKAACNAVMLKLGQLGTIAEAVQLAKNARRDDVAVVVCGREGDTDDSFIADFAVGINAGQLRVGGMARGERIAKFNQLIRIEEELGSDAYAKDRFAKPEGV